MRQPSVNDGSANWSGVADINPDLDDDGSHALRVVDVFARALLAD